MINACAMQGAQSVGYGKKNSVDSQLLDEARFESLPKILSVCELSGHKPTPVKGTPNLFHTRAIGFYRRDAAAANLFGYGKFAKWPRRPGTKNVAAQMAQKTAVT